MPSCQRDLFIFTYISTTQIRSGLTRYTVLFETENVFVNRQTILQFSFVRKAEKNHQKIDHTFKFLMHNCKSLHHNSIYIQILLSFMASFNLLIKYKDFDKVWEAYFNDKLFYRCDLQVDDCQTHEQPRIDNSQVRHCDASFFVYVTAVMKIKLDILRHLITRSLNYLSDPFADT